MDALIRKLNELAREGNLRKRIQEANEEIKYYPIGSKKPIILRHVPGGYGRDWQVVSNTEYVKTFETAQEAKTEFAKKLQNELVRQKADLRDFMEEQNRKKEEILEILKQVKTWEG